MTITLRQFAAEVDAEIQRNPEDFRLTVVQKRELLDRADQTILDWYQVKPRSRVN